MHTLTARPYRLQVLLAMATYSFSVVVAVRKINSYLLLLGSVERTVKIESGKQKCGIYTLYAPISLRFNYVMQDMHAAGPGKRITYVLRTVAFYVSCLHS